MAVMSLKGHDRGRVYLVIDVEESFVKLADGRLRGLGRLKKKRNSHIKPLGQAVDTCLVEQWYKLHENEADTNIRKSLSDFLIMNQ